MKDYLQYLNDRNELVANETDKSTREVAIKGLEILLDSAKR